MANRCPKQTRQTGGLEQERAGDELGRLVDPRAPAIALAALVEQEGQEAPRAVYRAFEDYNREHFDAGLQQSMILLMHPSSPRSLGDYTPKDLHGIPSRIRVAPKCMAVGLLYILDVLLHEMIHAWQHEAIENLEEGYEGHGPRFAEKCNEIGAELGLAEVAPKGRGGKAKAAHWPICVRPLGYYGPNDPRIPGPEEEGREGGGGDRQSSSTVPVRNGVVIDGLEQSDLHFLQVLSEADGADVAATVRRLMVDDARRMVRAGGAKASVMGEELARYERFLARTT